MRHAAEPPADGDGALLTHHAHAGTRVCHGQLRIHAAAAEQQR